MIKVTAIFDIGKTNKKFILFDKNYQEVFKVYKKFKEIKDKNGFPTDNLDAIIDWMKAVFDKILKNKKYDIQSLNFSTYGASLVYVDKNGKRLTPLYNYLKPFPKKIHAAFHKKYGDEKTIAKETASPSSGMLNAGFQLYWLKKTKPSVFKKIKYALHFPQYLSYLFTGIAVSEYTSIGCHTSLWNFKKGDYHRWVYQEKMDKILPPIVSTNISINKNYQGKNIKIGVGIHDSSAALLPYFLSSKKPFLLLSTGTWSIALNPFNKTILSKKDLDDDCLNYMRIDGNPVKAARLFMGKEYEIQVKKLNLYFKKEKGFHQKIKFSDKIFRQQTQTYQRKFHFEAIQLKRKQPAETNLENYVSYEEAYHQLMLELVELQVAAAQRTIGKKSVKQIYIDGGFANNKIFITLLSHYFKDLKISTTNSPVGSALGAAMVIDSKAIKPNFLKKYFGLINHSK